MICTVLLLLFQLKNNQFGSTFKSLSHHRPKEIVQYWRIVKLIVEAHQGKIDVKSSVGKGTTFVLWFPLGLGFVIE
jgi:light-regulated signal transduction histidine kinase (bacteriophytochrome)